MEKKTNIAFVLACNFITGLMIGGMHIVFQGV